MGYKSTRYRIQAIRKREDLLREGGRGEPVNPGGMDWWVTQRIPFDVAAPPSDNTGSMDWWVTQRIPLNIYAGRP